MDYSTIGSNISSGILLLDGEFEINDIMKVAAEHCPQEFGDAEIKEIALSILDELLNTGMVYVESVDDENQKITYKSFFSSEHEKDEEVLMNAEQSKQ